MLRPIASSSRTVSSIDDSQGYPKCFGNTREFFWIICDSIATCFRSPMAANMRPAVEIWLFVCTLIRVQYETANLFELAYIESARQDCSSARRCPLSTLWRCLTSSFRSSHVICFEFLLNLGQELSERAFMYGPRNFMKDCKDSIKFLW